MRIQSGAMLAPSRIINPRTREHVETRMMVDTGSEFTAICLLLAQKINLRPVDWCLVQGVDRDPFTAPVFNVDLVLQDCPVGNVDVLGLDFTGLGHGGLIGNDLLDRGLLVRDGETGHWYFALASGSCASTCTTRVPWQHYALAGAAGLVVGAGIVLLTRRK
jgi:hypothetical protein